VGGHPCQFIIIPSLMEYPVAWLHLTLTQDALHMALRPLPLPELRQRSLNAGEGQAWRAGRPEWEKMQIALN